MFLSVCKQQWIRFVLIVIAMHAVVLDAQKNSVRCKQVQDFVRADKRYMQFVFVDEHDNCTAGYYEAYDDPGDGGLFCYQNKIRIDTNLSQSHHQFFLQMHQQSVHRMQMHAISCNNIAQKQYISSLFLAGKISAEQAWMYEQMLDQKSLVAQVQKQANQVRKQAKKLDKNKVLLQEQSTIASTVIAELQEENDAMLKRSSENVCDDFYNVIKKRSKALKKSSNSGKVSKESFSIKPQTAAFLQIQGIDARQFQELTGLPIQHQLGQEIVDLLDRLAAYALQKHEQQGLISYCAHLAQMTEQANIQQALVQAVHGTNCCHAIYHYLTGLMSTVGQAHQQFQTALAYFDSVADSYRTFVLQHAAQGAITTYGLEAIATAGMVAAPTATVAATGMMIGATVCIMAPVCFQAGMHLKSFGTSCVVGDWDKIIKNLDDFHNFITSKETIARVAEFAGGASVSTPTLNYVVDQILSLRPVLVQVQNQAEQSVAKLYLMHKVKVKQVYQQSLELLQTPAFKHFHMMYEKILGCHFFDILPKNHPALFPAFAGIENNAISRREQALLTHLFAEQEGSAVGQAAKNCIVSIINKNYPISKEVLITNFAQTQVGQKVLAAIKKEYEEIIFTHAAKLYDRLIANKASQEMFNIFYKCQEISILPDEMAADFEKLHLLFKDKYLGLQEFSSENPYLQLQMRHIFYPNLQLKLDPLDKNAFKFNLNGFHHDENGLLEKSGLFRFFNKIEGPDGIFKADVDFGDGIIHNDKTFFPSGWSREKVAQFIFEASQNRIRDLTEIGSSNKTFLCRFLDLLIEIVIDSKNIIKSAYPSKLNFRI